LWLEIVDSEVRGVVWRGVDRRAKARRGEWWRVMVSSLEESRNDTEEEISAPGFLCLGSSVVAGSILTTLFEPVCFRISSANCRMENSCDGVM
jgi:hypothetical protein